MTDKEKAKAYDEAIKRAQEAANSGVVSQNFVDDIFQLRESENERIRKALVIMMKVPRKEIFEAQGITKEQALAYLEKQKEKSEKPIIPEKENEVMKAIEGTIRVYGKTQGSFLAGYDMDTLVEHLRKAFVALEKQKDQKPADNVSREEYVKKFKVLCDAYEIKLPNREYDIYHLCDDLSKLSIDSDKQKPEEKPINWTELTWKDINELEGIINKVHYEFRNGIGQESFGKEVLEKFREYKGDEYLDEIEQKPAEWSKEDEKIRKTLLDYYEKALDNYTCVEWLNGITYGELCDWLKSLRPHWKPSEEQMKALQNAVVLAAGNKVLAGLYEHLKKL